MLFFSFWNPKPVLKLFWKTKQYLKTVALVREDDNISDNIVNLCTTEVFYEIKRNVFNLKAKRT